MTDQNTNNRFRALSEVEAYWTALRRNGALPRRSDIDPRGIENALEYAFILERIAPGLARIRIAGMHLNELMGMETRGMPISSFLPPATRTAFSAVLEDVLEKPATARLMMSAETGIGKPRLEGQMLLLPLQSDMGDVNRVLGCLETHGPVGRGPRRFNLMGSDVRGLDRAPVSAAAQTAWDKAGINHPQIAEDAGDPANELAEHAAPFRRAPSNPIGGHKPRPGYLRLVKSD